MHLAEAPDLRAGRVYSEYEDEDDGEQDTSVGATRMVRESGETSQ